MAALDNLPTDLIHSLCSFLDQEDLRALSLTSSVFYPLAQPYIFRNLSLATLHTASRCIPVLNARNDLALQVRAFSLRLDPGVHPHHLFLASLAQALARMRNLISLDIVLPPAFNDIFADNYIKYMYYPRLSRFSCSWALDQRVSNFLQRTPYLKELQLGDIPGGSNNNTNIPLSPLKLSLPPSALPRLSLFMGSSDAATILVPGRPLETVHLYSGDLSEDVLAALARSASPITVFGALTNSLSPSILLSLASSLPHLHHLRIMTMYHSSNHPDESFYTQVVRILSSLPELATAELAGIRWAPRKDSSSGSRSLGRTRTLSARVHVPSHETRAASNSDITEVGLY